MRMLEKTQAESKNQTKIPNNQAKNLAWLFQLFMRKISVYILLELIVLKEARLKNVVSQSWLIRVQASLSQYPEVPWSTRNNSLCPGSSWTCNILQRDCFLGQAEVKWGWCSKERSAEVSSFPFLILMNRGDNCPLIAYLFSPIASLF